MSDTEKDLQSFLDNVMANKSEPESKPVSEPEPVPDTVSTLKVLDELAKAEAFDKKKNVFPVHNSMITINEIKFRVVASDKLKGRLVLNRVEFNLKGGKWTTHK